MTNFQKGISFGIVVGIAWGLDTVLMGMAGTHPLLTGSLTSTLITAFFHDGFCFVWLAIVMAFRQELGGTFRLLFKTRKGKASAMAALVGAPIGMSGFVLGIRFAGPAYASSISVIYPGVGAIMAYFILKEKMTFKGVIGVALSLLGAVALGYAKVDVSQYPRFALGIMLSGIAVIGWASEGVILAYAMKKIKREEHIPSTPQQFLTIRYFTSLVSYGLIVMPIIGAYPTIVPLVAQGVIWRFAGIAILGAITYLSWYKAVDYIGAAMGTALNSTAAFWAILFSWLIFKREITLYLGFWGLVIIVGVFIFATSGKKAKVKVKALG